MTKVPGVRGIRKGTPVKINYGADGLMVATAFEAGHVGNSPLVHAASRTLVGYRALCGEKPDRVNGRFDTADENACSRCLAVASAT